MIISVSGDFFYIHFGTANAMKMSKAIRRNSNAMSVVVADTGS